MYLIIFYKMNNNSKHNNKDDPTIIVIFGATGDLSKRKLIPALLDLYTKGFMPKKFSVVGFSRRDMSDSEYRDFVKQAIGLKKHSHSDDDINSFLEHIFYTKGLFGDVNTYDNLSKNLISIDEKWGICTNKLFYLAVPPSSYEIIFDNLANSGLTIPCGGDKGWTRVLVEKPFGKDLKTARELDHKLGLLFKEEQIFRIDHYLAKETLQNILSFRFSNVLFEPIWNKDYIEKVEIKLYESLGVGERGSFYNETGALRDVGQNHMLQMLAFIAMENPGELDGVRIRDNRAKVLKYLRPIKKEDIDKLVVRGQYKGFIDEIDVSPDSKIETYFKTKVFVDNDRWRDVPFYLESGKKLKKKTTEIIIYFKKSLTCICSAEEAKHSHQNILSFNIQPDEGIKILFWAKKPGLDIRLEPKELSFSYKSSKEELSKLPDAYEKVLYDCINGDQILFTSTKEVEAAWEFITPILENWNSTKLHIYEQGSNGPVVEL